MAADGRSRGGAARPLEEDDEGYVRRCQWALSLIVPVAARKASRVATRMQISTSLLFSDEIHSMEENADVRTITSCNKDSRCLRMTLNL